MSRSDGCGFSVVSSSVRKNIQRAGIGDHQECRLGPVGTPTTCRVLTIMTSPRLAPSSGVKLPRRSHAELSDLKQQAQSAVDDKRPLKDLNPLFWMMSPIFAPLAIISSLSTAMGDLEDAARLAEATRRLAEDDANAHPADRQEEPASKEKGPPHPGAPTPTKLTDPNVFDDSLTAFKHCVQSAMMVELETIPMYLYAFWSAQGSDAADQIRRIVIQEMNHLVLAGNILVSIGGSPKLYTMKTDEGFPLWWPTMMLDKEPVLRLELMPLDEVARQLFVTVEQNSDNMELKTAEREKLLPGHYFSLGDFYEGLETRARDVAKNNKFGIGLDRQITKSDGHFASGVEPISSLEDAISMMTRIINEGEGSTKNDPKCHLRLFTEMKLPEDPRKMPTSPQTPQYKDHEDIYAISRLFDASYTYLLLSIQALWQTVGPGRKDLATSVHVIMGDILTELAGWMSEQPFEDGVAGPCFAYFDFEKGKGGVGNAFEQLKELKDGLKELPSLQSLEECLKSIDGLKPLPPGSIVASE